MKRAAAPLLVGFVSIQAQALLLREYLVLFGGSELSIGIFMAAWFLWISVGALLFTASDRIRHFAVNHVEGLLTAWPFTIALAVPILRAAREFTGTPAYEPVGPMVLLAAALVTTLGFSTMTGLLFPAAAARQKTNRQRAAVRTYWLEAMGSVVGGAMVTMMLYLSVNLFTQVGIIAMIAMIPTIISLFYTRKRRILTYFGLFCAISAGFSILAAGPRINRYFARMQLYSATRGLTFVSRHETPYRVITLARSKGQRVVLSNGNIVLTKPFTSKDLGLSAFLLAQAGGRHILALGLEGLRLVPFTAYKNTSLTIVFPDWEAFRIISGFYKGFGPNVHFIAMDPRTFMAHTKERFNAVLIAGGEPSLLSTNRLYTIKAFQLARRVLRKHGVVAVPARIPENFMGAQFREYGKAIISSLDKVFKHIGIVPGAGGLFVAGNGPVDLAPADVISRFKKRAGTDTQFPATGFYSLLKPERQAFLKAQYQQAAPLLNTDMRPMAFYLKLLTLLKVGGAHHNTILILESFRRHTIPVLLVILAVIMLILLLGRFRLDTAGHYGAGFAIGATGAAGMGMVVLLFAAFQAVAGTLFRDIGLASAAFMLGLVIGARIMERPAAGFGLIARVVYTLIAGLLLAFIANLNLFDMTKPGFFVLFGLTGVITGGFWPVVSHIPQQTAARLETWDHLGAAVGALIFGVFVLPCLGIRGTGEAAGVLVVLAGIAMAMDRLHIPRRLHRVQAYIKHQTSPLPKTALVLTGLVFFAILALPWLMPAPKLKKFLPITKLRNYEAFSKAVKKASPFVHYDLSGVKNSKTGAIITLSAAVAPSIKGFAGPINLMISIDKKGTIRKVRVIQSGETPAYVVTFPRFLRQFKGKSIDLDLVLGKTKGIDAMTGATITSRAATRIINSIDRAVAIDLLHHTRLQAVTQQKIHIDPETWYVLALILLGLLVHYFAGPWVRLVFLGMVVIVGGIVLNVSLSIPWFQSLVRFNFPPFSNLHVFILTIFVLVTTPLLGTLWCAHLCPFGAGQELISRLGARLHLLRNPSFRIEKIMRGTRYILLLLVVLSLYGSNPAQAGEIDPLSTVFSGHLFGAALVLAIMVSLGALFNFRFYCRNLCPVGAFLSTLGGASSLFGLGPAHNFRHCDLGVNNHWDHDCTQCNRCKEPDTTKPIPRGRALTGVFYLAFLLTAAIIFSINLSSGQFNPTSRGIGRTRQVNMQKLQQRIQSNTLSDHKAMFFKKMEKSQ